MEPWKSSSKPDITKAAGRRYIAVCAEKSKKSPELRAASDSASPAASDPRTLTSLPHHRRGGRISSFFQSAQMRPVGKPFCPLDGRRLNPSERQPGGAERERQSNRHQNGAHP